MIRKTCCALAPFQAGLLIAFLLGSYAAAALPAAIGIGALVFALCRKVRAYTAVIAVSFCAGVAASCVYTALIYDNTIAFDGQVVSVKGYVYDMKEYDSGACVLTVKGRINEKVDARLGFFVNKSLLNSLSYGEEVTVTGKVYKISNSYSKAEGVFLQGRSVQSLVTHGKGRHKLFAAAKRLRDKAYDTLSVYGEGGAALGAML